MSKPTSKNEPARRERRNRDSEMMDAALQLFARKGYAAASVQDLADAMGVIKSSVYNYIDSKEDLLFRIFIGAHEENEALMLDVEKLDIDPLERLRTYIKLNLLTTLNNIERTGLYFRDWRHLTGVRRETLIQHRVQYSAFLRKLVEAAYRSENISAPVSLKHVSSFIIGATNWLADWYRPDGGEDPEFIADNYTYLAMATILGSAHKDPRPPKRSRQKKPIG